MFGVPNCRCGGERHWIQVEKTLKYRNHFSAVRQPNPLVVEASTYTPAPDVEPRRRRPKHVLYDHDHQIMCPKSTQTHNQHSVFTGEDEGLDV
ncbi:jg3074 [Pararge aegeria aegeria]|uniref:Jg3074 protein n=1 Tax=Pararge aegeria aegeria TaxID=348720 RepID=A0A8S4QNF4_9NEOP|nr:jg3074 [Pararge aegeria aegeria]